jgi:anti-anti-sigma factor
VDTPTSERGDHSPILNIETEDYGEAYVVRLSGEVDLGTITLLAGALDGQIHNSRNVILDCQHLTYIDSTGFNLLADLYRQARRFVLVAPVPTIKKILGIMGLDMLIPIAASVEEALNVLAKGGLGYSISAYTEASEPRKPDQLR